MDRDPYAVALGNALSEIKKAYPDIKQSLIFTHNGNIITGDQEADPQTMDKIKQTFESLKENAKTLGKLEGLQLTAKAGKVTLTKIEDIHLLIATTKNANTKHIYSAIHIIIPTIMKTLETFAPTHLQPTPPKKLVVETLTGLFAGDSVQIDTEILRQWTMDDDPRARVKAAITGEHPPQRSIEHVKIETFNGHSTLCKVKEIDDQRLKGKNLIRIPEKVCETLEVRRGDLVKVQPLL